MLKRFRFFIIVENIIINVGYFYVFLFVVVECIGKFKDYYRICIEIMKVDFFICNRECNYVCFL